MTNHAPRFTLGNIYATPGALYALAEAKENIATYLDRHVRGDWGELCDEDKQENEFSVSRRLRIFSAYRLKTGVKVWLITEADRSATTLLLPEEY